MEKRRNVIKAALGAGIGLILPEAACAKDDARNARLLYVAEGTKISRFDNIEDNLDNPPKPVVI